MAETGASQPIIQAFFDEPTNTVSYLVADLATGDAAIIDPVLDYDHASGEIHTGGAETILQAAAAAGYQIRFVLETHVHADHLSAAQYIKTKTGAAIGIGAHVTSVQQIFGPVFNADDLLPAGRDFDLLFTDGEVFSLGALQIEVIHTPGHTPADVTYKIADATFVGDTLFMPDYGTARADFPGGDAVQLYRSIRKLLDLPDRTRLFTCHDYKAPGRDVYAWESNVLDQRQTNIHARDGITEPEFMAMRHARDATLSAPHLLLPAIQVNMRAGRLPPPAPNGFQYLLIPTKKLF